MSDGPFKSLNLRAGWKALAQYADKPAFSSEEISDCCMSAVEKDFKKEIVDSGFAQDMFKVLIPDQQHALFATDTVSQLEDLRTKYSGSPYVARAIDAAQFMSRQGLEGNQVCVEALTSATQEHVSSTVRQLEEVLLRARQFPRASNLRSRIENAISNDGIADLAARSLTPNGFKMKFRTTKKTNLDDGVSL